MVFFEAMQALFALDLGFFIDIFMNNLVWVAVFGALIYFFFDGKRVLYWFLFWNPLVFMISSGRPMTGRSLTLDCRVATGTVLKYACLCGLPAFMSLAGGLHAQHITLGSGRAVCTVLKQNAFCGPSAFMNTPMPGKSSSGGGK